jgi:hypothetical protein
MTLSVNLSAELVEALRALAGRTGQDLDRTVAQLLQEQLRLYAPPATSTARPGAPSTMSPAETELLRQVQQGLPEATWQRYRELVARRETEELADAEQPELVALADTVEAWNVRRLELARKLADLRGVPCQTVLEELNLVAARPHG